MYMRKIDVEIINSDEVKKLRSEYQRRFGEDLRFSYSDFPENEEKCMAQVYKEELEKCLREGKPTSIIPAWRKHSSLTDH